MVISRERSVEEVLRAVTEKAREAAERTYYARVKY